jgi:hypothetical protein
MQSPIRTALRKVKLVDWHHRHTRDAMVLLGIGAVTFAAAHLNCFSLAWIMPTGKWMT